MARQLRVIGGKDSGRVFTLEEGKAFLLGRDYGTHARLKDPQVAMLHCEVVLEGGRATVTDRGSVGGTFVDDARVARHELAPGQVLRIGDTRLRLE